ncbi:peptide ligase PGM1-related protein [Oryzobacter terrae]|uniref:peptide ligase PGM1-related protein n=1 Tax=Oryzobacter terrae TaxID=1620385 RepID=UPI003670AB31
MRAYERLQQRLGSALAPPVAGSTLEHVVVALPSHSMPTTLLTHHASLLPALEQRALVDGLRLGTSPGVRVVVVLSAPPSPAVLDYYARLARPRSPGAARERLSCLVVPDDGARGVAAKLLDRPDLMAELRRRIAGDPAVIEPWNVTDDEVAVALALDRPLNGGPPSLWPLGFKSAARRLFRDAGVPVPAGVEDVHDAAEVAEAVRVMRRHLPRLDRVVVKLDNSGGGEGNWVMSTRDAAGAELATSELATRVETESPPWFLADLALGGVVEELVTGSEISSPSGQAEIRPDGEVVLLATHEQDMGGDDGHVFTGSRFPADGAWAPEIGRHVLAVGRRLAEAGAVGWLAVDFVAHRDGDGSLVAVDLNLRKGGTTHSFTALQCLARGAYDPERCEWVCDEDGSTRSYRSSDAVGGPGWLGMSPSRAIDSLTAAGLAFDHARGTGVVLHMFPGLDRDGTVGVTAIGRSAAEADDLFRAVPTALDVGPGPRDPDLPPAGAIG